MPPRSLPEILEEYYIDVSERVTTWGPVHHIEMSRVDNQPVHDWYDLFQIKEHLFPGRFAIEIYPPPELLVDAQHSYHLWVIEGVVPFGIHGTQDPESAFYAPPL